MSRAARSGGRSTPGRRASAERRRRPEDTDPDAVEFEAIDWESSEPLAVELDPSLVEQIRARRRLRQITLRVGEEQIAEARRVAARSGLKYQAVLRRWLAEGASIARTKRLGRASPGKRTRASKAS